MAQVLRTWNLKYLKTGLFLSLLIVIFGFLNPKNLPIKFQDGGMTRTTVITEWIYSKWRFYPKTPILVKFSNLNNFRTIRSWELKFSGIDHFNTIYKYWRNEQNLRGKGVCLILCKKKKWPGTSFQVAVLLQFLGNFLIN